MPRRFVKYAVGFTGILGAASGVGLLAYTQRPTESKPATPLEKQWLKKTTRKILTGELPNREKSLAQAKKVEEYDLVVIGGGATGVSVALDACTRGLKVLCVERDDFASGTSSRSTKLIHGGVRYLERAFLNVDPGEYELVKEAVAERKHLINVTPHLSEPFPLVLPLYSRSIWGYYDVIKFFFGLKIYDSVSGLANVIQPSYYLSNNMTKAIFPQVDPKRLLCSYVYYDGIHNDARMCMYMALTAACYGCHMLNHVECSSFLKDTKGQINGMVVKDMLTEETFNVKTKAVINATGPFSDAILKMDNPDAKNVIVPAAGVHVVLPHTKFSRTHGLLIPKTEDGRVCFCLPWEGSTIAGTTDALVEVSHIPEPTKDAVDSIIKELNSYLTEEVTLSDVDAVWTGIRPLAKFHSEGKGSTQAISRSHSINIAEESGLVTIAGGKWTTCRNMAEETLDALLETKPDLKEKATPCVTKHVMLYGSGGWSSRTQATLERHNLPTETAQHLSRNYGDKARDVGDLILDGHDKLIAGGYPFTEGEVLHQIRHEYARTAVDVLARRTRLAFLNKSSAEYALPRVIELMSRELNWDVKRRWKEFVDADRFLQTMHISDEHRWGTSHRGSIRKREIIDHILGIEGILSKDGVAFVMEQFEKTFEANDELLTRISVADAIRIGNQFSETFGVRCDLGTLLQGRDKIGYLALLASIAFANKESIRYSASN